jgi:iron complex transport system permease protein
MTRRALLPVLCLSVVIALLAHVLIGPSPLPFGEAASALVGGGGRIARAIVLEVRLPRALMAGLVGAALAMSGAALQGLLRNPLAEPGVLGVTSFATLGAVLAFETGLVSLSPLAAPLLALAAAAAASILIVALAWRIGGAAALVLIGVGLSSFASALVALALNLAPNPTALSDIVNWTLGAVANRSLGDVALAAPFILAGAALLLAAAPGLRALSLGEEAAGAIGADVKRTRALVIAGTAAAAGAASAFAGAIAFIGIAAPHLVRGPCGHDPGRILVPSALAGALMLIVADLIVRVLPTQQELRLGVAAALIGGPVFALIAARLARGATA